ncbi:MAG: glycosyltransferase [Bacteroidota bacterium]
MPRPPSSDEPLAVVAATDDGFAMPTVVALSSVARRSSVPLALHVIDGGMSETIADRLWGALGRVSVRAGQRGMPVHVAVHRPSSSQVQDLPTHAHITTPTYLRMLIPELLPEARRAVYLDGDVLATGDIAELADVPLVDPAGRPAPAAGEVSYPLGTLAGRRDQYRPEGFAPCYVGRDLPMDTPYMNAGVLVLDLDVWRSEALARSVLEDIRTHVDSYALMDQDGLNAVLAGRWARLPPRWNVRAGTALKGAVLPELSEVRLLHFTTGRKPWLGRYDDLERLGEPLPSYRKAWFAEAEQSGWFSAESWEAFRRRAALQRNLRRVLKGARRGPRRSR